MGRPVVDDLNNLLKSARCQLWNLPGHRYVLLLRILLPELRGSLHLPAEVQRKQEPHQRGEGAEQEVRLVDAKPEVS